MMSKAAICSVGTFVMSVHTFTFSQVNAPRPPDVVEGAETVKPVVQSISPLPLVDQLSWDKALEYAVKGHPSVLGALQRLYASNFDLDATEYQRFPALVIDFGRIAGNNVGNQASVSLTQPLYAFGRIDASIAAAEYRMSAATVAVDESKVDLVDRVLQAFFDVNKTRELVDVQQQFVIQHKELRDTVQRRFDGEVASQSDLLLAQTRLDQAENQLAVYQSQFEKSAATLRSLIKVNSLAYQTPEAMIPGVTSEEELQTMATKFSPLIKRLTAEQSALEQDARIASAATKPQLVLRAERIESNVPTQFTDNRVITALQYQPGAGFSANSIAAAAQSRAVAAQMDIQAAQLQLAERCATLYNDMLINLSQEKNLSKVLDANQEFFESMLRQFQAGKRSWLDVLNSVRETNQAATALVVARNDAQLNVRRVHNIAGLFYSESKN